MDLAGELDAGGGRADDEDSAVGELAWIAVGERSKRHDRRGDGAGDGWDRWQAGRPGRQYYGPGGEDVVGGVDVEALRRGAQDVRSLFSLDGGRTLRPFDIPLTAHGIPWLKRATSGGLQVLRGRFHRVLARHGCKTTDHFAGFQLTGRFHAPELAQLIRELPEGLTEFMCHPGYCGGELRHARTRLKESRERELEALLAPEVRTALVEAGVELVNYRGAGDALL